MDVPSHIPAVAHDVWDAVVAELPPAAPVPMFELEAYCYAVAQLRDAQERIAREGAVVADEKGRPVPHPALVIARTAQDDVRKWGARFAPKRPARRRPGTVYDATRRSVAAAKHLCDRPEFEGAIKATTTLAWLIDEAQRAGIEELQKAAFGTIPTYLKACAALQITPADVPEVTQRKKSTASKLANLNVIAGGAGA